jgi:amino acid adenylation domain-containing protein
MADRLDHSSTLPPEQEAIRVKCYHPSGTFVSFPRSAVEQSIPARFEQIVRRYPDRLAVKTKNHALTYEELNKAANRVAHAIVARRGIGEEPVALLMEKDAPLIAAVLGVLKAGKFYVPLDPAFPSGRISSMLSDSRAGVIITASRHHTLAAELAQDGIELLNLDALDPGFSAENPGLVLSASSLSWLLYTSGSTGQPKGVLQNHRNVLHRIMSYTNALHVCAEDRHLLLHSFSVSGGTTYALGALLNGAALFPFRLEEDGLGHLTEWLSQERITVYNSVPTIFRHLASILTGQEKFPAVRVIRLGGEPVHKTDVDLYVKHFPPHCIFVNELGSTEAEVIRRYFVDQETRIPGPMVPNGYAIEDKEVRLLDDDGHEVGFDRIGEIAVKSRYLCAGYWRLSRLTEATFLPDPDGGEEHIYRTGDLGRMRPDQCLEHLGRRDFQVKVRGYRVEIAEIEVALVRVDGIKEAAVGTWEEVPGNTRLVGYVVPARHPAPTVSEIRSGLNQKLPNHMVPAHFVYLDALPLTPNGKVDRHALPAPQPARPELDRPFAPPRTPTEEALVRIWTEVLGLHQVGIHDSFLELGGDSLLASRVISRVIDTFQVELLPRLLLAAPTLADMALAIAQRQPEEAGWAASGRRLADGEVFIERRRQPAAGPCPLSFGQQRLWFVNQMDPESAAYNMPRAVHIRGALNREALRRALDTIVARHEVLRTTYTLVDGRPMQVIGEPRAVVMPLIDLRESPDAEREEELQRLILADTRRPFDLSSDLMLRAALFQLGEDAHVLLLVTYHIASDRWSAGVLFRELAAAYRALASGDPLILPELPIQYTDFAVWQRQRFQGEVLANLLSYWKQQLGSYSSVLALPTDRPRPAIQTYRGAIQSIALSAPLTESLKSLGQKEGATLYMTLLAAFQALLYRYTGQEDIAVGSPIAGRTRVETEELIGFFVNTLVLRTDLSGNPTFRELLGRVREVALGAYAHQGVPFEKLVEELQPKRSMTHSPLYQVVFALRNTPRFTPELSGLITTPLELDRKAAPYEVVLYMTETERGLSGSLEYNTDLFDPATIRRMLGHFETLLTGIAADPGQTLSALPLLTASERRQLVVEWNDTRRDYPADRVIPELFEAQVVQTPDRVALAFEDESLTYNELNRRANQLAHHLRALGVRPEVPVALCVERSLEMIVGLLGILKAGGAYVPLDPSYPRQRLAFILEDTRAPVLVTQKRLRARLPEDGPRILCLDADWPAIARESDATPVTHATPDNLAYIMYTSGSTGRPKGVSVPHRAVVRLVKNTDYARLAPDEVFLHLAPLAFDASTFEIWGSLLNGARLAIFPPGVPSVAELSQALRRHQVTTLWLTAAFFHQVVEEDIGALGSVRQLLAGGDVLSVPHVNSVLRERPECQLINGYGPTESTTFACCFPVSDACEAGSSVPIGRPIANTRAYVLDRYQEPVPIGVPGELYIGGDGVARGYLNRPDLTAEQFVPDPFADRPDARLYRTGDLVRYRPDGTLEFLGRVDDQVKIRGFRVEPGEIEAVLRQHPTVRDVVVVAREDRPGDKSLVAYFEVRGETGAARDQLRQYLGERLPTHMIPSGFVRLPALPLTPSGKVDRRALAAAKQTRLDVDRASGAPRTPLEDALAKLWANVLGLERVGVEDNFFDLGGHSLLAMRLCDHIEKTFGKRLPVATLFQAPTVGHLAGLLSQDGWPAPLSSLVALQPNGSKPPFFWVHGENSNAFLSRYLPPDQPLYGLLQQSREGQRALYTRMEDIAAHYLGELRRAQPRGPYFLGGYCIGGTLAFEIAQQLRRQGEEIALLVLLDPSRPGNGESSLSFSSHASRSLPDAPSFGDLVSRRWRTLARLEPQAKLAYIWDGVSTHLRGQLTKITHTAKKVACTIYSVAGTTYRLPPSLRIPYIEAVHRRAARGYVPQVYPGRVVVFTTEGGPRDPRSVWGRLAAGGLEIYAVPGRHQEIVFKEPHIQGLAKQLNACLDRAQDTACSRDRPTLR